MLNPQRLQALEKWKRENGIKLSQVNGQRKYGGPPDGWEGPVPAGGCEVFVGRFPPETYEDLLIPLFSAVGPLWEFRLMMNFSGQNRGFAYAKYSTRALAAAAVCQLHGHELEPGLRLSVRHSTEKRQLCLGELPASTRWAELLRVLMHLSSGVEGLSLKSGPDIKGMSALVVYESHHAASMAKKVMVEGFKKLFSLRVSVKWQQCPSMNRGGGLRLPSPSPTKTAFNRAVGAPVSPPPPPNVEEEEKEAVTTTTTAACGLSLLGQLCGTSPAMALEFSHVDEGGCVHFAYRVRLPGAGGRPLCGTAAATLSHDAAATLDRVRQSVAWQVLAAVNRRTSSLLFYTCL
ncbi:hypothetical protein NHX12_011939 [Muraenolepis orangiensis]|uniref:RRM domain-containing protein n=1 Tax=Muraenolepis orangiensis TaxID=630683 RepID=A0A9Q0DIT2_9TELE|nr:hypothetical protein NHX12_011939 [Muraenolepis orangiensis]